MGSLMSPNVNSAFCKESPIFIILLGQEKYVLPLTGQSALCQECHPQRHRRKTKGKVFPSLVQLNDSRK